MTINGFPSPLVINPNVEENKRQGMNIVYRLYNDTNFDPQLLTIFIISALYVYANEMLSVPEDGTIKNIPCTTNLWKIISRYFLKEVSQYVQPK